MAIELHVLADARSLESFRLARGTHVLGSTENADLLLSSRDAVGDVCRVKLTDAGTVNFRSLADTLRLPDGTTDTEVTLRNGQSVEIGRLQLLVHDRAPAARMHTADPAPAIPETAPSEAVIHPSHERLALRIRSGRDVRVIEVDRASMVFGRGPEIGVDSIQFLGTATAGAGAAARAPATIENLPAHLDGIREDWCRRALAESSGNVRAAARMLGLSPSTMHNYLTRFRIAFDPEDSDA